MIEMGESAVPAFFDHNFDGLMDFVVGNYGYYQGPSTALTVLHLYENIGSATAPKFKLIDDDYAGISQINLIPDLGIPTFNLAPAFGDLDDDFDADMILGDFQGVLHYFENIPSGGVSEFHHDTNLLKDVDVGQLSTPFIFDLNRDGLLDVIVGEQNGTLNYYENTGTKTDPQFTLITENLGGVDVSPWWSLQGYSQPVFYFHQNNMRLLCGSRSGRIYLYDNIEGNLSGTFNRVDTAYLGIDEGDNSRIAVHDLDGDSKLEFLTGNFSGGVTLYTTGVPVTVRGGGGTGHR